MIRSLIRPGVAVALVLAAGALVPILGGPRFDGLAARSPRPTVVLAGGCYWGMESVFRHVRGVTTVTSGYALPVKDSGAGSAAPAEAVRIVYDPAKISYRQILELFFSVAHDPTEVDRQGPDVGAEYRSIVFVDGDSLRSVVRSFIDSLTAAHAYPRPIATQIASLQSFHVVDGSQQDYAARHPDDPYIVINDVPKIKALRQRFPQFYRN